MFAANNYQLMIKSIIAHKGVTVWSPQWTFQDHKGSFYFMIWVERKIENEYVENLKIWNMFRDLFKFM